MVRQDVYKRQLILPGAISAYNLILMRNFVAAIPPSLEEAAYIAGANELQLLWKVLVTLCKPALATFTLFHAVGHWNGYFKMCIRDRTQSAARYPSRTYGPACAHRSSRPCAPTPGRARPWGTPYSCLLYTSRCV